MAVGLVIMSERELNRIEVLIQVSQGRMTAVTAANLLGSSRRQVHRLLKRFETEGAASIRHKARGRPSNRHPELCRRVVERLKSGWTPDQIGNRMIHEGARLLVSQETIYRYIYSNEGMAQELWCYLLEHRGPQSLHSSWHTRY